MPVDKVDAVLAADIVKETLSKLELYPSFVTRLRNLLGITGSSYIPNLPGPVPEQSKLVRPGLIADSVISNLESSTSLINVLRTKLNLPLLNQGAAPVCSKPTINGDPHVGETLSVAGTYNVTGTPPLTITKKWYYINTGIEIPGANTDTYTPVTADANKQIGFRVTASNSAGTNNNSANPVTVLSRSTVGSVTVINEGNGYTSAPIVTITGGGGIGATAIANMTETGTIGQNTFSISDVNKINLLTYEFTSLPTIQSYFHSGGVITEPTFNIELITLHDLGTGTVSNTTPYNSGVPDGIYTKNAEAMFYGTYIKIPNVTFTIENNTVVDFVVNDPGYGWLSTTHTFKIERDGVFGDVLLITMPTVLSTRPGKGCTLTPLSVGLFGSNDILTISYAGGGDVAQAVTTNTFIPVSVAQTLYKVSSITVNNGGAEYTSVPAVSFTGGGDGSGATAVAALIPYP